MSFKHYYIFCLKSFPLRLQKLYFPVLSKRLLLVLHFIRSGTMICASDFWRIFLEDFFITRIDRKSSTQTLQYIYSQNPQQCVGETIPFLQWQRHILQSIPLTERFKFIIYLQKMCYMSNRNP